MRYLLTASIKSDRCPGAVWPATWYVDADSRDEAKTEALEIVKGYHLQILPAFSYVADWWLQDETQVPA
jgi:hypothetical protein